MTLPKYKMASSPNYIVLQCYGNERVFHECTYALLTLSRLYEASELNNVEIWLYTDNESWFRKFKDCHLPIYFRPLDKEIIARWRGEINFVHRVKIEMLKDFAKSRTGNILYLDTDIVFTHRIDDIFRNIDAGELYMHTMEGFICDEGNPIFRKLNRYLGERLLNGKPLGKMAMWNAGVLGFNTRQGGLLDAVLAFTDAEYPHFPKHVVEQFAFSVYFQQAGIMKAAAPYIFHYWTLKETARVLASFFEYYNGKKWSDLVRYSTALQVPALMQEKINFFHNRGVVSSVINKKWVPEKRDWAELEKQL